MEVLLISALSNQPSLIFTTTNNSATVIILTNLYSVLNKYILILNYLSLVEGQFLLRIIPFNKKPFFRKSGLSRMVIS